MKKSVPGPRSLLLLAGVVIVCLLLAEAFSRLLLTEESSSVIRLGWRDSYIKGRPIRKEAGVVLHHEPFSTRFNTAKPTGTFRIIFLDDSFNFLASEGGMPRFEGQPFIEQGAFPRILEAFLRYVVTSNSLPEGHNPLVKDYEVLYFGAPGYALVQLEHVFYEALAFEPDLLIYMYQPYDFGTTTSLVRSSFAAGIGNWPDWSATENWSDWSASEYWLIGHNQSVPYLSPFPGNGKLLLHSWAYRFLNQKLSAAIQKLDPEFTPRTFDIVGERAKQSLGRMIAAARRERVPFVIMLLSFREGMGTTEGGETRNPAVANCHSGLYIWDVSRKVASSYSEEELTISTTTYNMLGHAVLAEALQPYFEKYVLNQSALGHLIPADDEKAGCTIV